MAKEQTPPEPTPEPESDMLEIGLTDATYQQLLWFATDRNYECSENDTQHQLYSKIRAAWPHPTISVPRVIDDDIERPNRSNVAPGLPPFVKLKILSVGDDAKTEEHLALNGRTYRIQVGHVVTIPREVFQGCILDAQELRYRSDSDTGLGEPMVVQAINFTRIE